MTRLTETDIAVGREFLEGKTPHGSLRWGGLFPGVNSSSRLAGSGLIFVVAVRARLGV